jgi:hypothetical protein
MQKIRQEWIQKLEKRREYEMLGMVDFAKEIGIQFITYKKLIDPSIPPLSMSTLRTVRNYLEMIEEEDD